MGREGGNGERRREGADDKVRGRRRKEREERRKGEGKGLGKERHGREE